MMGVTKLSDPTKAEDAAAERVKQLVVTMLDELPDWDVDRLAEELGLLPAGARVLMERSWDLTTAWRVAEALKLSPRLNAVGYPRPKTKTCPDCGGIGMEDHWSECILCKGTGRVLG